jgi:hypothetical protein
MNPADAERLEELRQALGMLFCLAKDEAYVCDNFSWQRL